MLWDFKIICAIYLCSFFIDGWYYSDIWKDVSGVELCLWISVSYCSLNTRAKLKCLFKQSKRYQSYNNCQLQGYLVYSTEWLHFFLLTMDTYTGLPFLLVVQKWTVSHSHFCLCCVKLRGRWEQQRNQAALARGPFWCA